MRCKPGDLCVVVSGRPAKNIGRFVTVRQSRIILGLVMWFYDGELTGPDGSRILGVADDCLHPIRPPSAPQSTVVPAEDFAHG